MVMIIKPIAIAKCLSLLYYLPLTVGSLDPQCFHSLLEKGFEGSNFLYMCFPLVDVYRQVTFL